MTKKLLVTALTVLIFSCFAGLASLGVSSLWGSTAQWAFLPVVFVCGFFFGSCLVGCWRD